MSDSSIIKVDKSAKSQVNGTTNEISLIMDAKSFGGRQQVFQHDSHENSCSMKFSIYVPEIQSPNEKFHTVIFLSGIMCNEQNFLFKTGFQKYANQERLIVVGADTSPRGVEFKGDGEAPIFGRSAGWYLDATEEPWNKNYRMYSYICHELPDVIRNNFPTTGKFGLIGHSMGGNGAIVVGLRNPSTFQCISLMAPSCNPTSWGQELIYRKYLGDDEESWKLFDACCVIGKYDGPLREILLDQGAEDEYLDFLLPSRLKQCADNNPNSNNSVNVDLTIHDGYDHSYFFVASFIEKHLIYHKKVLDAVE